MTPNTRVWCLSIIAPVIYAVCIRYIFDAGLFIDYLAVMSVTFLDKHIVIGGDYFDVLDGTYELQQLDAKTCRLHLYSHFTIKTTFNFYAYWWAEMDHAGYPIQYSGGNPNKIGSSIVVYSHYGRQEKNTGHRGIRQSRTL